LNAVEILSGYYDRIFILHRNVTGFDWTFPPNVQLVAPKKCFPVREVEKAGVIKKITWFLYFTVKLYRLNRNKKPDTVLLYDSLPVLSYRIVAPFIAKPRILWYHNHDVSEAKYITKYNLAWLAWKSEPWILQRLQLFTLPAEERKICFPMEKLKGEFFFLPNFPSRTMYNKEPLKDKYFSTVRILYQGSIGQGHGLEEIILLLKEKILGKTLSLVLKGFISQEYLDELKTIAAKEGVAEQLVYLPPSGYREVIDNAYTCHIGIGIHKKDDMMNRTLATASNKIYEYAAAGMPVILYDNEHFRSTLQQYTSRASLLEIIKMLLLNYDEYSLAARSDFENKLCFEQYFDKVVNFLQLN
jgi:glycosyltransferase involved in cell wall biosynthesis